LFRLPRDGDSMNPTYTPSPTAYADTSAARLLMELERHLADVPDRLRCGCDLCTTYGVICRTVAIIDERRQAARAKGL